MRRTLPQGSPLFLRATCFHYYYMNFILGGNFKLSRAAPSTIRAAGDAVVNIARIRAGATPPAKEKNGRISERGRVRNRNRSHSGTRGATTRNGGSSARRECSKNLMRVPEISTETIGLYLSTLSRGNVAPARANRASTRKVLSPSAKVTQACPVPYLPAEPTTKRAL